MQQQHVSSTTFNSLAQSIDDFNLYLEDLTPVQKWVLWNGRVWDSYYLLSRYRNLDYVFE